MGLDVGAYTETKNGKRVAAPEEWFTETPFLIRSGGWNDQLNWFRGKSYATFIERITGYSLYSPKIPDKDVKKLYSSLRAYYDHLVRDPINNNWAARPTDYHRPRLEEVECLMNWFKAAAENDCWVEGDW